MCEDHFAWEAWFLGLCARRELGGQPPNPCLRDLATAAWPPQTWTPCAQWCVRAWPACRAGCQVLHHCPLPHAQLYESNNQKERERAEEALLERIGASAAAVEAARAAVSTHSGAGARLDVHLVGSHPTCLQSQLGILSQATSQSVCMFAATCVKGCVEHFYQQMPAGTASTLQAQLWNMVIKDAGSPSPRLPRNIRNSVLYTVCRLAALAWVDDVSVRQVASLCLDRLADAHGGSRSIVAMQAALGSPSSAPPSQASSIPFDIASRVIRELVRTMAVSAVALQVHRLPAKRFCVTRAPLPAPPPPSSGCGRHNFRHRHHLAGMEGVPAQGCRACILSGSSDSSVNVRAPADTQPGQRGGQHLGERAGLHRIRRQVPGGSPSGSLAASAEGRPQGRRQLSGLRLPAQHPDHSPAAVLDTAGRRERLRHSRRHARAALTG